MDTEPVNFLQLPLFIYGESVANIVELFPAVWKYTESLTSPDVITRQRGIDNLIEIGAQKVSPLVAYMIATCLSDSDLFIRRRVTFILADIVISNTGVKQIPEEVRKVALNYLHNMRESTIYGLLEVSVADPHADEVIYHLFNACPYAGRVLGDILSDWKNPLQIKQKAIYFVGLVGFTESLPALERLFNRLEARQSGQYLMDFAPASSKSDSDLLPYLREAIEKLNKR